MQTTLRKFFAQPILLLAAFCYNPSLHGFEPSASEILKATEKTAGLAVHVGTSDGILEADLAQSGRLLVQGLAASLQNVAAARQLIQARGLYGQATVVNWRDPRRLPYADNLETSDVGTANPASISQEDIPNNPGQLVEHWLAQPEVSGWTTESVTATALGVDGATGSHEEYCQNLGECASNRASSAPGSTAAREWVRVPKRGFCFEIPVVELFPPPSHWKEMRSFRQKLCRI